MTRGQRDMHVRLWALALIAVLAVFGATLIVRERIAEAAARVGLGGP